MPIKTEKVYVDMAANLSNAIDTMSLPRHRWYYYKEGFSPNLVNKAIDELQLGENDLIIDPFNGSGTVTLTSAMRGIPSIGVEVNPFTAFIARTKSYNVEWKDLEDYSKSLIEAIKNDAHTTSRWIGISTFTENDRLKKWLFNRPVADAYEIGFRFLDSVRSVEIRDILKLALVSSLMANANARRDGKCFKYKKGWKTNEYDKVSFLENLLSKLKVCLEDVKKTHVKAHPLVVCQDSRSFLRDSDKDGFSLCITSPPYLNTFDYTDIYRPELFLGGFIPSNEALYQLRLNTVRSHVQALWTTPTVNNFGAEYAKVMEHLLDHQDLLMSNRIPMMVQAYFEDIKDILESWFRKMRNNGQVWIVVSTSAYAGMEIPVDTIIGYIGTTVGFKLKGIEKLRDIRKRKTKNSGNIDFLRESLIKLMKA